MTIDDLERDWRSIYFEDVLSERLYLRDAFDACLGRLGKAGTPFADFLYFAKQTAQGQRIKLLKVGPDGACILLSCSGPGGFQEEEVGWLYYGKPEGRRP